MTTALTGAKIRYVPLRHAISRSERGLRFGAGSDLCDLNVTQPRVWMLLAPRRAPVPFPVGGIVSRRSSGDVRWVDAAGGTAQMTGVAASARSFSAGQHEYGRVHAHPLAVDRHFAVASGVSAVRVQDAFIGRLGQQLRDSLAQPLQRLTFMRESAVGVAISVPPPIVTMAAPGLVRGLLTARLRALVRRCFGLVRLVIVRATQPFCKVDALTAIHGTGPHAVTIAVGV